MQNLPGASYALQSILVQDNEPIHHSTRPTKILWKNYMNLWSSQTYLFCLYNFNYSDSDIHHANLPKTWRTPYYQFAPATHHMQHTTSHYATIIIKLLFSLFPEKYSHFHVNRTRRLNILVRLTFFPNEIGHFRFSCSRNRPIFDSFFQHPPKNTKLNTF